MDKFNFDLQLFAEEKITVKEVKEFFEKEKENEEVKTFLQGLKEAKKISVEEVNQFLETEEGKKLLTPRLHSHFDKTLTKWKEDHLEEEFKTKLADEIAVRYPEETEDQKRLKALEKAKEETDIKLLKSELKNVSVKFLTEAKLPLDLVDYLIDQDETKTLENLGKFKTMMDVFQKTVTEELIKKYGREPAAGVEPPTPIEELEKQYAEAQEKGDTFNAVKLYDQIHAARLETKRKSGG